MLRRKHDEEQYITGVETSSLLDVVEKDRFSHVLNRSDDDSGAPSAHRTSLLCKTLCSFRRLPHHATRMYALKRVICHPIESISFDANPNRFQAPVLSRSSILDVSGIAPSVVSTSQEQQTQPQASWPVGSESGGQVFWGQDKATGQDVAIKVILKNNLNTRKELKKRIWREIKTLRTLHHPNIVRLYDVCKSDNTLEVVFELATGGEVFRRVLSPLHNFYMLSERHVSRVIRQVVSALEYLHYDKELVHGDIRPEHLLYGSVDVESKILLVDFGRTVHFSVYGRSPGYRRRKRCNIRSTSIHDIFFMSPQLLTKARLDRHEAFHVDVWALGVILFAMLFGSYPFDGKTEAEIKYKMCHVGVRMPKKLDACVSRAAKDLLRQMLRYHNNSELMSIQEVKNHPWVTGAAACNVEFSNEHILQLQAFAERRGKDKEVMNGLSVDDESYKRADDRVSFVSTNGNIVEEDPIVNIHQVEEVSPDSLMRRAEAELSDLHSSTFIQSVKR